MTGKSGRSPGIKHLKLATNYRKGCECGVVDQWTYSTNGDGSSVQICTRCQRIFPVGRQYQDESVGVRLIAFSMLSALKTSTPKDQ